MLKLFLMARVKETDQTFTKSEPFSLQKQELHMQVIIQVYKYIQEYVYIFEYVYWLKCFATTCKFVLGILQGNLDFLSEYIHHRNINV